MKDRFTLGFLSGLAGWIPQFLFTTAIYYIFHLPKLRYLDFSAILTYSHKPQNWLQTIFAELIVAGFLGVLGAIFALIIKVIKSSNIILKGALFGAGLWFLIYAIAYILRIEGLYKEADFFTAVLNLIGAIIWGTSTAAAIIVLNSRFTNNSLVTKNQESKRYHFTPSPAKKPDGEIRPVRLRKPVKIKKNGK